MRHDIIFREQIEGMVRDIIADVERERITARASEALPPTGHNLWDRFDSEATGSAEFTTWQMVALHGIVSRLASLRAETCDDPRERALWVAYTLVYEGHEELAREFLQQADA